ncbi:IclR family transcriptional regulator [Pollutimonas nitritireducens]|uniref:IclR family transcriptional regulator n=2 Tax=Pollutimonas nitritireducens TaxID=2045209 RepID=A0A2N4UAG8_9BURK|nr:IclR family transcriptional regulator [Pollutimonas nitritireducens]
MNSNIMTKKSSLGLSPEIAEKKEGVAAVNRALQVLNAFESSEDGLTLSMLANETGLYQSTILRLLESLMLAGFVKRLPDGRYVVGPRALILSEMYRRSFNMTDYVVPRLKQLVAAVDECASLYVREGDQRICLHHIQPRRSVRMHVVEGKHFGLNVGAAGHVIRAIGDGAEGERYDTIRRLGYSVSQGERDPESAAVACPVFMHGTSLMGAISVVIPLYRFDEATLEKLVPEIKRTALELSEDLGGISPYRP